MSNERVPPYGFTSFRDYQLTKDFGISEADYDRMFEKQGWKCKICGRYREEGENNFAVDHNHKTGLLRGILCRSCNTGLGRFKDDIKLLSRAIVYLQDSEEDLS